MFELYIELMLRHSCFFFFNYTLANIIRTSEVCYSHVIAEKAVGAL